MKKRTIVFVIFCIAFTTLSAQNINSQKEKFKPVYENAKALVTTKNYKFEATWVFFNKKREQLNSSENTITLKKSKSTGQLQLLSSNNKILDLKGEVQNYKALFDADTQSIKITYSVISKYNNYYLELDIVQNGNAFLNVVYNNNSNISYVGRLK